MRPAILAALRSGPKSTYNLAVAVHHADTQPRMLLLLRVLATMADEGLVVAESRDEVFWRLPERKSPWVLAFACLAVVVFVNVAVLLLPSPAALLPLLVVVVIFVLTLSGTWGRLGRSSVVVHGGPRPRDGPDESHSPKN